MRREYDWNMVYEHRNLIRVRKEIIASWLGDKFIHFTGMDIYIYTEFSFFATCGSFLVGINRLSDGRSNEKIINKRLYER